MRSVQVNKPKGMFGYRSAMQCHIRYYNYVMYYKNFSVQKRSSTSQCLTGSTLLSSSIWIKMKSWFHTHCRGPFAGKLLEEWQKLKGRMRTGSEVTGFRHSWHSRMAVFRHMSSTSYAGACAPETKVTLTLNAGSRSAGWSSPANFNPSMHLFNDWNWHLMSTQQTNFRNLVLLGFAQRFIHTLICN